MLAHEAVKTANMFSSLTKTNSMGGSSTAKAQSSGRESVATAARATARGGSSHSGHPRGARGATRLEQTLRAHGDHPHLLPERRAVSAAEQPATFPACCCCTGQPRCSAGQLSVSGEQVRDDGSSGDCTPSADGWRGCGGCEGHYRPVAGDVEDAEDVNAEAERAAKSLSRLVRAHALSLHGVDLDSPLTKDVQDLEAKIAQVMNADEAVRGQTIRESFQRRDLRSDGLSLHETRLKKLTKLVEERVRSSEQQHEEVTKSLQDMQDRKDAELAPLRKKKTVASAEVQTLRQKQEELEAQLRAVKIEERFIADTARFRAEHQHVTRRFSRAQRRRVITTEVNRVENEVRQARLAHSQVHTLRAKQTGCISQQLEASLNYFESELPCVKFMMSRVEENEAKLAPMRGEIASYRALGVSAVAEELEEKAAEIEAHLEEDRNCLSALHKRDDELLGSMRRILTDSSLRDALAGVEERVKHESQRMIDYVSKLYEDSDSQLAKESSDDTKSNGTNAPRIAGAPQWQWDNLTGQSAHFEVPHLQFFE
ncbi:hypothetical protein GQ600_20205 [Phytophthora cactorum]|nr:hypothetical protein GQ600_20205 [Phytophthora cactorum]